MIVMDENTCMVDIAKFFLNFLRDESCGKCLSCHEGTQRLWEIVTDITQGRGELTDLELLNELAHAIKDASMCGLGQTAANPVLSTLRYFKKEYIQHIKYKRCPALVCRELVSAPCQYICPIEQEASVYIALIAQQKFDEAYRVIIKDNPFPSVCGRVCDHQCGSVCRASEFGEPIAIRSLKRFVMDWASEKDLDPPVPKKASADSKKVAVVGAGPAGLTAGYNLTLKGYKVTIFEASPVAGGWLALGIPDHRLPKEVLKRDIDNILKTGIELKTNTALGKDLSLDDLFGKDYKAIFIAIGAHKSMKLDITGEDSEGVIKGTQLLKDFNLNKEIKLGARIGIIGGGNVAIDAARSAIRKPNTDSVTIFYRRTRKEMPAYAEEIEAALEEGINIQFLCAPTKVLAENGKVIGIECIRMRLGKKDTSGRRRPLPIEDSEFIVKLDTLIPAIGERPDTGFLGNSLNTTKWGTIVADKETLCTDRPGVFAGGDVLTGPGTVVKAISAGKIAANSIDKYLQGKNLTREYTMSRPSQYLDPVKLTEEEIETATRPQMPQLPVEQRNNNFKEVMLGYTKEMAVSEARRCLRCELETEDGKKAVESKQ
jgi:NADH-quinone oxidoreductase subunit F